MTLTQESDTLATILDRIVQAYDEFSPQFCKAWIGRRSTRLITAGV